MFSDHGKQDNSRKNSSNNENLFFLLLEEEQALRVCRTGATKSVTFVKVTPSKRRKIYPDFKGAFCHTRYFYIKFKTFETVVDKQSHIYLV